jgi:uncharacterized protein YegL
MNHYLSSIVNNLNNFVKNNKHIPNLFLSVVTFSTGIHFIIKLQNIKDVQEFNINQFDMSGLTRLYDSICDVLVTFEEFNKNRECQQHLLIISDGEDNSSWRFNKESMNKLCDESKKYNWTIKNYNTNFIEDLTIPTIVFDINNEDDISTALINLLDRIDTMSPKKWWSENHSQELNYKKLRNFLFDSFGNKLNGILDNIDKVKFIL